MRLIRSNGTFELAVGHVELEIMKASINVALTYIDDWEFSTRLGYERDEVSELLCELSSEKLQHGSDSDLDIVVVMSRAQLSMVLSSIRETLEVLPADDLHHRLGVEQAEVQQLLNAIKHHSA